MDMDLRTQQKIREILTFVLESPHSAFYRNKYAPGGIRALTDIRMPQDFSRLPFLVRDELLSGDPFGRLFFEEKDTDIVSFTSGTTSTEPLILFKNLARHSINPRALNKIKTKKNKRILLLLRPHQIPLNYVARREQQILVVAGDVNRLKESACLASKLGVNIIQTTPSIIISFVPFLRKFYDLSDIEVIYLTGEPLTVPQFNLLKTLFRKCKIITRYSTQETGNIGYKCNNLIENSADLNTYHLRSKFIFTELFGRDPTTSAGELVVTTLEKLPTPLIRYRTGDLVEFLEEKCSCGLRDPLFKVLGRVRNDKIKLNGIEFRLDSFERATRCILNYVEDSFAAHFYQKIVDDKIVGEIIVDLTPRPHVKITPVLHAFIEETINNELHVSNRFSFKNFIAQGLFLPVKVKFVEPKHNTYKMPLSKKLVPHF